MTKRLRREYRIEKKFQSVTTCKQWESFYLILFLQPRGTIMQKHLLLQKNLLVRKGFSSPIWKYFGFPCNPSDPTEPACEDEIVCALCNKCLSYNKSTTVMHKHLKGRHPNVFDTLVKAPPEKKMAKGKVGRPKGVRSTMVSTIPVLLKYYFGFLFGTKISSTNTPWK